MRRFLPALVLALAVALPTAVVEAKSKPKPPKTGSWSGKDTAGDTMTFKVKKKNKKLKIAGTVTYTATCATSGGQPLPSQQETSDFSGAVSKTGKVSFSGGSGGSYGGSSYTISGAIHKGSGTLKYEVDVSSDTQDCKLKKTAFSVKRS